MAAQPLPRPVPAAPVTLRLVDAPASEPAEREPEWVERSWAATRREAERFLRTAWAFGIRPRETARLWGEGRFDAQNPLAYLLNVAALLGTWRGVWSWAMHISSPLWLEFLHAVSPYLGVLISASAMHVFLRRAGGKRRLTSTWAISIYATSGSIPLGLNLLGTPFLLIATSIKTHADWRAHWLAWVLSQAVVYPIFFWAVAGYAGLHGLRRRRVVGAVIASAVLVVFVGYWIMGQALLAQYLLTHH